MLSSIASYFNLKDARLCLKFLLTLSHALAISGLLVASDTQGKALSGIDAYIDKTLETFHVPGASVAVVRGNEVLLCAGYGKRDVASDAPVTENTLFSIGSCTKAFTALVVEQLVQEGKLSWDDLVSFHLPEFRLYDAYSTNQVTLRDLVAHRTGISRYDPIWVIRGCEKNEVLDLLALLKPTCGLRTEFQYNNFMYTVLGMVIEKITGLFWEQAVSVRILQPLKMHDTTPYYTTAMHSSNVALPHAAISQVQVVPFGKIDAVLPGAGLWSTASDMTKWLQLCPVDTSIFMPFPEGDKQVVTLNGYGLGWMVGSYRDRTFISHGGMVQGFTADVAILPSQQIGIAVLTNSSSDGHFVCTAIRNEILDRLLGQQDTDWLAQSQMPYTQSKEAIKQAKKKIQETQSSFSLCDYQGSYEHPAYGQVNIRQEDTKLMLSYGNLEVELFPQAEDLFVGDVLTLEIYGINPSLEFTFTKDPISGVCQLHIPFEYFRNVPAVSFTKINQETGSRH